MFHVLPDGLSEVLPVVEDEFAGQDDESLGTVPVEMFPAVVEQLGELARIAQGRRILEAALRVEGDARLRGVAHHEAHPFLFGQPQVSLMVLIGIDGSGNAVHPLHLIDDRTLLHALLAHVVTALLGEETLQSLARSGLYHHDTVLLHHPVHESPQEISFSELYYLHNLLNS